MDRTVSASMRHKALSCLVLVSTLGGAVTVATGQSGKMHTFETRTMKFDADTVALTGPNDPGFDDELRATVRDWYSTATVLKPLLALFRNRSARTVVAYAVSFKVVRPDGTWERNLVQFHYPDAVFAPSPGGKPMPRGRELYAGERRAIGLSFEIDPESDNQWIGTYGKTESEQALRGATAVEIALDAVLFNDGELVGPNESHVDSEFLVYLTAKRHIYQQVIDAVDGGASVAAAFERLHVPSPRELPGPVSGNVTNAIGEARRLRGAIGDVDIVRVLKDAVRSKPFVVAKRPRP